MLAGADEASYFGEGQLSLILRLKPASLPTAQIRHAEFAP
jgi:hypothetical protein